MSARRPCIISGCTKPWVERRGKPSPFCTVHLGRLEQNRKRGLKPARALAEMRVELAGLASAVPDTPNISPQDWAAFLAALRDYRSMALDRAFAPKTRAILDGLAPLERHLLRRRIVGETARTPFGEVDLLDLVGSDETGWRVERREPLDWANPPDVGSE